MFHYASRSVLVNLLSSFYTKLLDRLGKLTLAVEGIETACKLLKVNSYGGE